MRLFFLLPIVLFSCSGSTEDDNSSEVSESDSLSSEIVIDEERVTAVEFNNELTYMQEGMLDQVDILFASDSSNVDLNLENAIFEAQSSLQKLEVMETFENSDEFMNAMKDLFRFYEEELSQNFGNIAIILKKENLSEVDDNTLEAYDLSFSQKEAEAFEKVFETQDAFAAENKIRLTDQ